MHSPASMSRLRFSVICCDSVPESSLPRGLPALLPSGRKDAQGTRTAQQGECGTAVGHGQLNATGRAHEAQKSREPRPRCRCRNDDQCGEECCLGLSTAVDGEEYCTTCLRVLAPEESSDEADDADESTSGDAVDEDVQCGQPEFLWACYQRKATLLVSSERGSR